MPIGEILSKLTEKRLSHYGIKYRHPMDEFLDLLLPPDKLKPIRINSVLVITDRRPRSLFSIAYAIRFAQLFEANLLAITKGLHHDLIKEEAKENNVNLVLLETFSRTPSMGRVLKIIKEHDVDLVILHNLHELVGEVQENAPVPVLVVKVERLLQALKAPK